MDSLGAFAGMASAVPDEMVDAAIAIAGTPDEVRARLSAFA
jgi:hypothetical protein